MQRWRQSDEQKRNTGFRNENKNKRKRSGPSENALQLSEDLKRLSREKKLDKALELYWDKANDGIRDGHHVCIIVDLTARCGLILEGEKLLKKVKEAGTRIGCETKTALMKVRFFILFKKLTQSDNPVCFVSRILYLHTLSLYSWNGFKGYCHSGYMKKASELFLSMCLSKGG